PMMASALPIPEYCAAGKSDVRSARDVQPPGVPMLVPSTKTCTVPPSAPSAFAAPGESTQPKLPNEPEITSPWPGVSIAPNGFTDALLLHVIVFDPRLAAWPSRSNAYAVNVNVPFPRFGRKLVSIR